MNKPSNKNDLLSLQTDITSLTTEVEVARKDVANGIKVDLTEFQSKVSTFCNAINTNPPPESETPEFLASIEALLNKINELQSELTELESGTNEKSNDKKNGDVT